MTVSRHESSICSISQVTLEVPSPLTSSLHRALKLWTSRRGGSAGSALPGGWAEPQSAREGPADDHEADALYIRFRETTVTTQHLAEGIAADYDFEGRLTGIEILDAMKRLGDPSVFQQVVLEGVNGPGST